MRRSGRPCELSKVVPCPHPSSAADVKTFQRHESARIMFKSIELHRVRQWLPEGLLGTYGPPRASKRDTSGFRRIKLRRKRPCMGARSCPSAFRPSMSASGQKREQPGSMSGHTWNEPRRRSSMTKRSPKPIEPLSVEALSADAERSTHYRRTVLRSRKRAPDSEVPRRAISGMEITKQLRRRDNFEECEKRVTQESGWWS